MIAVLRNCGLKLTGLTLEPIAALSVTIPEDMRLLNLVLVDVGAGTSDIAVTEKGRITAYGMIPKAGDEITEQICNEFLTDFRQAEIIKRSVNEITGASGKDIFGNPFSVTYEEFCRVIGGKTNEVAKDVADEILALNGKQPRAVVMVGGGSGLRLLREMVAENLALPLNRVGCREPRDVLSLENLPETLAGAEGATPLGILETALYNRGLGFIEITLNGEKEYIINLDQKIKVIDSLIARGIELKSLYGKPGNALTFTLNGKLKIIRGSQGEHVKFFVNNLEKNLESEIVSGDVINMSPPKNGQDAVVTMRDIIPFESGLTVEINSKMEKIEPKVFVNGKEVGIEEAVLDRADITIEKPETVGQALLKVGFTFDNGAERDIIITIGGEPVVLKQRNYKLKINGQEGSFESPIRNLDKIEFSDKPSYYRIKDILNTPGRKKVTIMINKMPYELEAEEFEVYMNGRKTGEDEFIINGAEIEVKAVDDRMMLSHIFKTYPIDTQRAKGKMLDLRVNGEKAGYTTPIKSGDQVDIRFL
jgi:cell division ATPase FtsA